MERHAQGRPGIPSFMDRKRELTSVDIAALVTELRGYQGAHVEKVYLYGDALLRFRMRDAETGRLELLVEVGDQKRAHLADPTHVPDAPERPPDFAMQLRNRLDGTRLTGVDQFAFDRVLCLEFAGADRSVTVIVELFGDGNLVVTTADREVVQCLRTVRLKSRTVAAGAQYEFPSERFEPFAADPETFTARIRQSDADIVRTLATQLNFGGLWAEEICSRGEVEKTLDVADLDQETLDTLYDVVSDIGRRVRSGTLDPRVYTDPESGDEPVDATPLAMQEYRHLESETFETFWGALDTFFTSIDTGAETATGQQPDFEAEIEKRQRIVTQQREAIEEFSEHADLERRRAELLYAHYDLVDEILRTVREAREEGRTWEEIADRLAAGRDREIPAAQAVVGVDGDDGLLRIELEDVQVPIDPSIGVEKNADRHYQEAKRIQEKREGAEEALEETRTELEALKERRETWSPDGAADDTEPGHADDVDWLSQSSIPVRRDEEWYERFRWFHTSDDFLVLGGRNADQNEELVKKYTEPGDRFLHAEAHGGPVTVLKATGPSEAARAVDIPEQSRQEAAQFAVSYSSVWRDGHFAGDVYEVAPSQVSKTPESGEYLEKGAFAVRGERTYHRDVAVGVAVGVQCEPETRVIGGPPPAIQPRTATTVTLEPGRYAQNDVATRIYRTFRERFDDTGFVRQIASADEIQRFLPPGGSRLLD